MRGKVAIVAVLLAATACAQDVGDGALPGASVSPTPSETSEPKPPQQRGQSLVSFPHPDRRVPLRAAKLADELHETERKLERAISMWLDRGGERLSRPGKRVALGALWQQKMIRVVTKRPKLAQKVIRRLPGWLARKVRVHVEAGAGLRALSSPLDPPIKMRVTPPDDPHKLRRYYKTAGGRFNIPTHILASLNFVESKFGRFMGPSSAGAEGPMQFMPGTWAIYGRGNVWNPHDAIMGAARYLRASGAPERMRDALLAYNASGPYADAVLTYADEMRRRPYSYYSYYFWQVFVRTTKGDLQLTGPGKDT